MFEPPRCPYRACVHHQDPAPRFWTHFGSYHPRCRPQPVPRFRCRGCRRTFSRQTFRADYRDHKPHLNAPLMELLCAGLGLRNSARLLRLERGCAAKKLRRFGRHARRLDENLRATPEARVALRGTLRLHLDEFESYEGRRNTRPVSIAVAVESDSRFMLGARAAPIRPRGKMTPARLEAIADEEKVHGKRPDRSRAAVRSVLRRAAETAPGCRAVVLWSDEKTTYPGLAARAFPGRDLAHHREKSIAPRNTRNPLFAINHTEACLRDWLGRLRRESWLVSKHRWFLNRHLYLFQAWRNWVKPRFNHDRCTPGQILGLIDAKLKASQFYGWRQDWQGRSPHPLGNGSAEVGGPAEERRGIGNENGGDDGTEFATFTVGFAV